MTAPDWWHKPRKIYVLVDNESWILPYAQQLVDWCNDNGDHAKLCRAHEQIEQGVAAFYLGCIHITPPDILTRNHYNLVVHESALPHGRGFAPMSWQILNGENEIPICLLNAANEVDAGDIFYRESITLNATELCDEWRALQGEKTIALCQRFLNQQTLPIATPQEGEATLYKRRNPEDSQLDPSKSIVAQFDHLRIVNNNDYPAFFTHRGQRYILKIEKDDT